MRDEMRKLVVWVSALAVFMAVIFLPEVLVRAQARNAQGAKKAAPAPTRNGRPDLQGLWSFATVTPLQRPKDLADKAVLTAEEAAKLEEQAVRDRFVDQPPPPGDPGAYNRFWFDSGTEVVGTRRTSLVIDPPDGRIPPLTPNGTQREDARAARRKIAAGPEDLPPWDRCIIGFNAGPPIIPSVYNNMLHIFQTQDHVVVLTEMVHDVRIIPLDGRPRLSPNIRQWKGDSRARWEGDTLVVETKSFRSDGTGTLQLDPEYWGRGLGLSGDENLHLVERLRRVDADTLLYEFTMNDPTIWTRPWTMSTTMRRSDEPLYEYACHEGNYAMTGVLSAARAAEKRASKE
jgi:hypothetical protein